MLPALEARGERPKTLVGTSSGALNAAFLAAKAHVPAAEATEQLVSLWSNMESGQVFRLPVTLPLRLASRLDRGLLDTSPLEKTIRDALGEPRRIALNLRNGDLDALAVVATHAATGRTTVFAELGDRVALPANDDRKGIDYVAADGGIGPRHLMASAAVPAAFPPIEIGGEWYVDGGLRLNTPIKPALSLRVDRVAVVATDPALHRTSPQPEPGSRRRPDLDDAFLLFMQAALSDPLIEDMHRLARTNTLIEEATSGAGDEIESVDSNGSERKMRTIPYLFAGPEERGVLGRKAAEVAERLGISESRILSWVAGQQGSQQKELLSYVLFEPEFAREAIELGRADAEREFKTLADLGTDWRIEPLA
jgi:NTE family protein